MAFDLYETWQIENNGYSKILVEDVFASMRAIFHGDIALEQDIDFVSSKFVSAAVACWPCTALT